MEKYAFTTLAWLNLSDRDASNASKWYQGSGWYYNPVDEAGQPLPPRLVQEAESSKHGQLDALRACGQEGWFVAALVPAPAEGMWVHLVADLVGQQHGGQHVILQRRIDR